MYSVDLTFILELQYNIEPKYVSTFWIVLYRHIETAFPLYLLFPHFVQRTRNG
jgi:hypothetical protein